MKIKQIIKLSGFCVLLFLTSCQKSAEYVDVLFFTGTEDSNIAILAATDATSAIGMTITATDVMSSDVKINVKIRPELVAELNQKTGRSFQTLPEGVNCSLSADYMTIKDGKHLSDQIKLEIAASPLIEGGVNYCIPVSIINVEGSDISILDASRTLYVVVQKQITTQAFDLQKNAYFNVPSFLLNPDVMALPQITLECRVLAESFHASNPWISSIIGIEEKFLIRFGDVSVERDEIMLAGGEVSADGVVIGKYQLAAVGYKFNTNQWYHVAAVYTGKTMELYVDGKRVASTGAFQGQINFGFDWAGGFHIGYSADGRKLDGFISEARVWTVARTAAQLQENMCAVDPTTPGLLAYWKLDALDGTQATDLTGHGHHAIRKAGTTAWAPVKCPE